LAVIVPTLLVIAGCGKIVGIHDFSATDAGPRFDVPAKDVASDHETDLGAVDSRPRLDTNFAEAGMWLDGSVDGPFDLPIATDAALSAINAIDANDDGPIGRDGAPDAKTCPSLNWQWATTNIWANGGRGACNYSSGTLPTLVAAIDDLGFDQTRGCGICLRLVPGRTDVVTKYVDVLVVDSAGSGGEGRQLNISREAMDAIATPDTQNIGLNFAVVPCSPQLISPTIHMTEQSASNPQHLAVQVRDLSLPLTSIDVWFAGTWSAMTFAPYNYWIFDSAGIATPYSFRLSNSLGDTLVLDSVTLSSTASEDGPLVDTGSQFPRCLP
jgi:expansin (peptidoglycan-binding protein)